MGSTGQLLIVVLSVATVLTENTTTNNVRFPADFLFGVATSAYQIEGAWNEDGKSENFWEHYIHNHPNFVEDGNTGDVACDSYHKLDEDIALLKELGVKHYRFSLSWTRLLPSGFNDTINPLGVKYYKSLIKKLKCAKIVPFVTIFHWDLPQSLQELGGFLNSSLVDWFADYARVCFELFGNDVKYWATFNEPKSVCLNGYGYGIYPPQIRSPGILDFQCSHNLLKAHAKAYRIYDEEFRSKQNGKITIVLDTPWVQPYSNSTEDAVAAETYQQFDLGWYGNPVYWGDYPEIMKTRIANRSLAEGRNQSRLPEFTDEEKVALKGSADYFALNTYTGGLAKYIPEVPVSDPPTRFGDIGVQAIQPASWENSTTSWLKVAPWGVRTLLNWIKDHYNNPDIIITENGYPDNGGLDDPKRISYHQRYLSYIRNTMIKDGVKVFGYTAWSLMDTFEWSSGFSQRLGLYSVDFNDPLRPRTPKLSAKFYRQVVNTRCLLDKQEDCVDETL